MLYYIHGYLSNPLSDKGLILKEKLNVRAIKYRNSKPEDLIINDCLKCIHNEIKNDKESILIGSSFGGFLAAKTSLNNSNVKMIILINPAIIPPNVNINSIKDMPKRLLIDMKDEFLFRTRIDADIHNLIGTEDYIIPNFWSIEFAKVQEANVKFFNDDHRFTKNINNLPDIISNIIYQKS